jgi:transposase
LIEPQTISSFLATIFKRWADKGVWQIVFNTLGEDTDMEWVRIDSTIVRAHQHAAGAKKGVQNQA